MHRGLWCLLGRAAGTYVYGDFPAAVSAVANCRRADTT